MNKDVIYIDVEDDITAIIGKVKASKEKVIALVPPKRTGVLQSAVNLRILQRTAKSSGKHIVLITNDHTLLPLAAAAALPVAKNLQSKPEVPEIAALKVDDDDDIIDGSQLSVGEHAAAAAATKPAEKHIPIDSATDKKPYAAPPKSGESPRKPKAAGKVPNFGSFRKRLILIGAAIILLIAFLVWAIFFAPRAIVEITAKTSSENLSTSVQLAQNAQTDASKGTIKAVQVEEKIDSSIDFQATGTETKGEKAVGTVTLSNCGSRNGVEVAAGTAVSYGQYNFLISKTVTVPGGSSSSPFGSCDRPGKVNVQVTAQDVGEDYNLPSGTDFEVAGKSSMGATNGANFTGGSKRTYKIVTQADVQKASEQIAQQNNSDVKAKLEAKFGKNIKVIDSSLRTLKADTAPSPQVGQEAPNGTAKLTSSVTYAMNGVSTSELESFIDKATLAKLSKENDQRVYDSGAVSAQLADFTATDNGGTANLTATAKVGPQINDDDIKKRTAGKKFGDIQSDLKSIQGVDNVEVHFWPFWVTTVPSDPTKVDIQFKVDR